MRQINILPEEIGAARKGYQIKVSLAITVSLLAGVLVLVHILLGVMTYKRERISHELTPPPTMETKFEQLRQEFKLTYNERGKFLQDNLAFRTVVRGRISYPDLLKGLSYSTHQKVWLIRLLLEAENGIFELSGYSPGTESVSEFLFRLKRLPFFISVDLVTMEKAPERDVVNFKVKCELR